MRKTAAILFVYFLGVFVLSAQSVKVKSPNGGEQWALNSSQAITWTFANAGSVKVNIVLRNSGGKVGVIKSQVALSAGSFTWTSVGTLEDGTVVASGTDYIVRIRDEGNTFGDESDAAFSISGAPAPPVIKKIPPLERPPVSLIFPPQPRITSFSMNKELTLFGIAAENAGGPMKQDALVVLSIPGGAGSRQVSQTWPKGKQYFSWVDRLFANDKDPHVADCTQMGGGDYSLWAEIRSPEVVGTPYPGLSRYSPSFPCWQDLAVAGFQWSASGALSFAVGNNGYCPSFPWSYLLYKDGQLVETSPRFGSKAPGAWGTITANYHVPAGNGASCTFRVEVVSENPGAEKNKANNTLEVTTAPSSLQYQIAIADIQFYGDTMYGFQAPVGDEHYRLVFTLRNTSNKAWPQCPAQCRIFIDNGKVYEGSFPVSFDPYEEFLIIHDKGFPSFPVVPYGIHKVEVWVNICPTSLTKRMMRPPQG